MSENKELRELEVRRHPDRLLAIVPSVLQIRHGVAEALNLHGAHLGVQGEVGQVHGARGGHCEPDAAVNILQ